MGWKSSKPILSDRADQPHSQKVSQLLETYRQKCISTCLLYPTFHSSSVIMTMSTPRALPGATVLSASVPITRPQPARPPRPRRHGSSFVEFWSNQRIRDVFLSNVASKDLGSLRLASRDFSVRAAPFLFANLTITFRSRTFTQPARMAALERIGRHVRALTFCMPHSPETFLPPLLDPITGEEVVFTYVPQTLCPNSLVWRIKNPKYGSWELTDLLIKQYGPLFHAATNVPAFTRAFAAMARISHLKISCPGQLAAQRYRRSSVDYALISLRIAVERAPLVRLRTLSLLPIHPGAMLYLRALPGFGASPRSRRRWTQIKKIVVHVDSWDFEAPGAPTDHLKLLHDYFSQLSPNLERLSFGWKGQSGPCPFTFRGKASSMTGRGSKTALPTMHFPLLRHMELSRAHLHASEVSSFIDRHHRTLRECDFEHVVLLSGDWDGALAVLTRLSGSERWKEEQRVEESSGAGTDLPCRDAWFGSPHHLNELLRSSVVVT